MHLSKIMIIVLTFASAIGHAQENWQEDTSVAEQKRASSAWLSAEGGVQELNLDKFYSETASCENFSLRMPLGTRAGFIFRYERTFRGYAYKSFDGGIDVVILRLGKFEVAPSLAIFGDSRGETGLMLSATPAYMIFDGLFRLQATLSYRLAAEINMGGGHSLTSFSATGGLGVSINRLLPGGHL